jgi:hypothetical protein
MSYVDIVICIGSLPVLETWPPIYRGQERMVRDRLRVSQSSPYVYFRYTPCLIDFTFEFIRRPISPILSPSSRTFVELTLVSHSSTNVWVSTIQMMCGSCVPSAMVRLPAHTIDIEKTYNTGRSTRSHETLMKRTNRSIASSSTQIRHGTELGL